MTRGAESKRRRAVSQQTKRQHIVPVTYLLGWADAREHVRVVRKADQKSFVTSVRNATVESKFYTLFAPGGVESNVVEDALAGVEGRAAEALRRVRSGTWPLDANDREAVAHLVAFQLVRGRPMRAVVDRFYDQVIEKADAMSQQMSALRTADPKRYESVVAAQSGLGIADGPGVPVSEVVENRWQTPLMLARSAPAMASMISAFDWRLLRATSNEFVTSDHPMTMWPRPEVSAFYGTGLATAMRTTFPLGRNVCLELPPLDEQRVPGSPSDDVVELDAAQVALVNKITMRAAHSEIITHTSFLVG